MRTVYVQRGVAWLFYAHAQKGVTLFNLSSMLALINIPIMVIATLSHESSTLYVIDEKLTIDKINGGFSTTMHNVIFYAKATYGT